MDPQQEIELRTENQRLQDELRQTKVELNSWRDVAKRYFEDWHEAQQMLDMIRADEDEQREQGYLIDPLKANHRQQAIDCNRKEAADLAMVN
jgi:hypothetical protein